MTEPTDENKDPIDQYFDEQEPDIDKLRDLLANDPEARQQFVHRAMFEAHLHSAARAAAIDAPTIVETDRIPRFTQRRRLALAALLLISLGGILAWLIVSRAATDHPYELMSGTIEANGVALDTLTDNKELTASGKRPATIRMSDQSIIQIAPQGKVLLRRGKKQSQLRQTVELRQGRAMLSVKRGKRQFQVKTNTALVTVLGTAFTVDYQPADKGRLAVSVASGKVRVDHAGGSALLSAGEHQVFDRDGMQLRTIRGQLIQLLPEQQTLVLSTGRGKQQLRFPWTERCQVDSEGIMLTPADLKPGSLLSCRIDGMSRISEITLQKPSQKVHILQIDRALKQVTVVADQARAAPITYAVSPSVDIKAKNKASDFAALNIGDFIAIKLSSDWSTIEAITKLPPRQQPERSKKSRPRKDKVKP